MKKIITMLLTISLIVCTLSIHACAAEYNSPWATYFDRWKTWFDKVVQMQEQEPEEASPAETEKPTLEEPAAPAESEEPEVPTESEVPEEPEETEPAEEYTIRYDANGGYWWSQYASPAISNSKKYTVEAREVHKIISAPIRTGYTFHGWEAPDGSVFQPGEKITPTENMTFIAIWR